MPHSQMLVNFCLDLASVLTVVSVLYRKRHGRSGQQTVYIAVNVAVMITISLLSSVQVDFRVGFGLFGLLRLLHLRSKTASQDESAYWFAVLVLGVVNGVELPDWRMAVVLNLMIVLTLAGVDSRKLRYKAIQCRVTLNEIVHDETLLILELEQRLSGRVIHHIVEEVDYVRESMLVDVRFQPDSPLYSSDRNDPLRPPRTRPDPRLPAAQ